MSRIQQDQFVDDDEDECCPLCVEEFDLSDKNFRPCPCGYQICQFCFNNIKTTMNGLCPACRRKYDDSTIEWKNITPEEISKHKQQIAQKAKKNAQMRQKEAQKAEADSLSRKHLAGLRVVQKNLVYVTGLTPTIREDRLLDTLRGNDYFGQYGKIIKIVVSKARENAQHQQSVGVYVTFARKEDAAACIAAVDGSQNGDRTLRAQYGTTKYCSAYLRGEQCNNRNCMFLHEPGEDNDSFTRQDLSMMNSIQTQGPAQSVASRPAPPAHPGPPVAAASAPMNRQDSTDAGSSEDIPGLPATAHWGSKAAQERRASRSTNASNPSPMTTNAVPAPPPVTKPSKAEEPPKKKGKEKEKEKEKEKSAESSKSATPQPQPQPPVQSQPAPRPPKPQIPVLDSLFKTIMAPDFKFIFSSTMFSEEEFKAVAEFPQLLDPNGGAKRRAMREKEKELIAQRESEAQAVSQQQPDQQQSAPAEAEEQETTAGGSLQLGGEPEETHQPGASHLNQHAIAPPGQQTLGGNLFGQNSSLPEEFSNLGLGASRGLTQQQQQQLLLSNFKSGPQAAGLLSQFQNSQPQQSHATGNGPGHTRHASRFSFANDSASASASVQPVANQKLMNQQSSMMPKNNNHFNQIPQHQALGGQFYTGGVQVPPPGLKATPTPPVSGGGMFSQGHGFAAGGLGYGANTGARNNSDALYQELLRGRNLDGGARVADAGKRESMFPSFLNQHPTTSAPAPAPGLLNFPYAPSPPYQETGSQKSKKKGKKHRHANTSSSGGGVVDVQDPSILQARLHQGGGMVGQGLYGQGQDDQILSPEEEASINVDALVSDSVDDSQGRNTSIDNHMFYQPRRATPIIPPGFSVPAVPKTLANENPTRPLSRNASGVTAPIVPVVPTLGRAATPVKIKKTKQVTEAIESTSTTATADPSSIPSTPAKQGPKISSIKTDAVADALRKASEDVLSVENKENKAMAASPAKTTSKSKATGKKAQPTTDVSPQKDMKPVANATPSSTSKRQHPGKLDIAAATKLHDNEASFTASSMKQETSSKLTRTVPMATNSVPPSPAATSTGSPIKKPIGAKTLRVVATPRTETPPQLSVVAPTALPQVPTVEKLRSRQASIASINVPGTPGSELISDTASFTSTSISRANSPPPLGGKVGSAPIRKKTKSQQKKERQERARQVEEERVTEEHTPEPEVVQAPIVGRKKKTRKPTSNAKAAAASAKSQPEPPRPVEVEDIKEHSEPPTAPPTTPKKATETKAPLSSPRPESVAGSDTIKEKREPTAHAILAELQKTGELIASTLEFFKPLSSSLAHASRAAQTSGGPVAPPDLKIHFSEADLEALTKKLPVRLNGSDGKPDSRTLITPQGKFLWGLTQELEEKALDLEKRIEERKGAARFHPKKQAHKSISLQPQPNLPALATALKEAGTKLSKNTEQAMPNLDPASLPLPLVQAPADLPPSQQAQTQQTPADAGAYLNQFVLPKTDNPPPNTPRPEMAAVGGLPGAGTANMSVNANKLAKAAKAVAEGGAVGSDFEGIGAMTADLLGGVFVQNLEALVGADLGLPSSSFDDIQRNMLSLEIEGLAHSLQRAGHGGSGRRGRRSVLTVEEAEQAMLAAKKDHEALEKKLAALMKRNKKMLSTGKA